MNRAVKITPRRTVFRRSVLTVSLLAFTSGMAVAQIPPASTEPANDDHPDVFVVDVWAENTSPPELEETAGPVLSRAFATAALRALASLREWRQHIAFAIRNGYRLSEYCISDDRDRAADALRLAMLAASSDPDRIAVQELAVNYKDTRLWSDQLVEANRKLEMAKYYMSSTSLDDDELFQKTAQCADFLGPMFTSLRLGEDPACR